MAQNQTGGEQTLLYCGWNVHPTFLQEKNFLSITSTPTTKHDTQNTQFLRRSLLAVLAVFEDCLSRPPVQVYYTPELIVVTDQRPLFDTDTARDIRTMSVSRNEGVLDCQ